MQCNIRRKSRREFTTSEKAFYLNMHGLCPFFRVKNYIPVDAKRFSMNLVSMSRKFDRFDKWSKWDRKFRNLMGKMYKSQFTLQQIFGLNSSAFNYFDQR